MPQVCSRMLAHCSPTAVVSDCVVFMLPPSPHCTSAAQSIPKLAFPPGPSLFPFLPPAFNRWASYQILQPRWVHVPYLRAVHMVTCKMLGEYFDAIQPDLVVSANHSQCVGRLQRNTWNV